MPSYDTHRYQAAAAAAVLVQQEEGVAVQTEAEQAAAAEEEYENLSENFQTANALREKAMMQPEASGTVQDKYTQIYVPVRRMTEPASQPASKQQQTVVQQCSNSSTPYHTMQAATCSNNTFYLRRVESSSWFVLASQDASLHPRECVLVLCELVPDWVDL